MHWLLEVLGEASPQDDHRHRPEHAILRQSSRMIQALERHDAIRHGLFYCPVVFVGQVFVERLKPSCLIKIR